MRLVVCGLALTILGSTCAYAQDQIGENCIGAELVHIGKNAPKVVRYTLSFSADLAAGYYCYAECKPWQTYRINNAVSDPIRLADVNGGYQTRLMTFDRKTAILTDHQVIRLLGSTTRDAKAVCRPAAFHKPTPLPGD